MTDRPQQGTPEDGRVRDVLRDLGDRDGATMPPELVARIEASLAEERRDREGSHPVVPLETRRRRSRAPWLLGAAAAAAVAVALPAMLDGPVGQGAESAADLGSEDAARAASVPPSPQLTDDTASATAPPFALSVSERAYTQDRLAADAAVALSTEQRQAQAVPSMSAESPGLGPLATEQGASDCLAEIGAPGARPVLVDVGTFDGQHGFLVIAQEDGQTRAWAIAPGCEPIYDAPVTLP